MKADAILAVGNDLSTLSLDSEGQVPDENLGFGNDTWFLFAQLEEEADPSHYIVLLGSFMWLQSRRCLKSSPLMTLS